MLNVLTMMGRLTRDPELRRTNDGTFVGAFSIACDGLPKGGEKQVVFLNVTIFGKQAETLVKFFKKGSLIAFNGRLTQRKYVNKDNVTVNVTEAIADRIEFVESKADRENSQEPVADGANPEKGIEQAQNVADMDIDDQDLPF